MPSGQVIVIKCTAAISFLMMDCSNFPFLKAALFFHVAEALSLDYFL